MENIPIKPEVIAQEDLASSTFIGSDTVMFDLAKIKPHSHTMGRIGDL